MRQSEITPNTVDVRDPIFTFFFASPEREERKWGETQVKPHCRSGLFGHFQAEKMGLITSNTGCLGHRCGGSGVEGRMVVTPRKALFNRPTFVFDMAPPLPPQTKVHHQKLSRTEMMSLDINGQRSSKR